MKVRWLILCTAGAVVLAAWAAVVITYAFFHPTIATWTIVVTIAALSTEGFLWVAAGVLGFSFLARRKATLMRLKQRFFGGSRRQAE
ncbi:hypothetical protein [Terricaulis sp.]|uniref:hypothetical protein n=1 Tax=Terricaulis sp. TaxID=2768686 RepID=UPI0037830AEC